MRHGERERTGSYLVASYGRLRPRYAYAAVTARPSQDVAAASSAFAGAAVDIQKMSRAAPQPSHTNRYAHVINAMTLSEPPPLRNIRTGDASGGVTARTATTSAETRLPTRCRMVATCAEGSADGAFKSTTIA